eukprot:CAMPEP_0183330562 /NCGR_PEP_ID=MMETSP0160_2-20130417/85366_1 /TAXON_ID=2839 ORGANISM="Odontella Sinensis, Strain Grunow 1884" /NCGR_SAMPLE_ID=MMETSP0160_2 /ASSEMBLY_ACC=CAM_ASM_000250 /LENGTH=72 /DNA_ID=CAMNT_0025498771 /DNA_START=529 /DNA_END=744 /DNA_ORIENTATION=-
MIEHSNPSIDRSGEGMGLSFDGAGTAGGGAGDGGSGDYGAGDEEETGGAFGGVEGIEGGIHVVSASSSSAPS